MSPMKNASGFFLYSVVAIHTIGITINLSLMIFFIFEWRNKKSIFRTSYFIILVFGYFMNTLFSIVWIPSFVIGGNLNETFLGIPFLLISFHVQNILGLWDCILGFNRCTAIGFPLLHGRIWNKTAIISILILFLIFPFLLHGYSFSIAECQFIYFYTFQCLSVIMIKQNVLASTANAILGLASLLFIIIGILKAPKTQAISATFEKRLILQTSFSAATLVILSLIGLIPGNQENPVLSLISYYIYIIQYYPSVIILFCVSPALREGFAEFYKFNYCFGRFGSERDNRTRGRNGKNQIRVIQIK